MNKKGQNNVLIAGMVSFVGFVLIIALVLMLLSVTESTDMVCGGGTNETLTWEQGTCFSCASDPRNNSWTWTFNTTDMLCHKDDELNSTKAGAEYGGAAYNSTKELGLAANITPQFGEVIVIVVVISGILALLSAVGFAAYKRFK